jgi:hypothetical protein
VVVDRRNVLNDRVTAALGFAELLLEGSYGNLSPQQETAINNVVAAARDARDILRDASPSLVED